MRALDEDGELMDHHKSSAAGSRSIIPTRTAKVKPSRRTLGDAVGVSGISALPRPLHRVRLWTLIRSAIAASSLPFWFFGGPNSLCHALQTRLCLVTSKTNENSPAPSLSLCTFDFCRKSPLTTHHPVLVQRLFVAINCPHASRSASKFCRRRTGEPANFD